MGKMKAQVERYGLDSDYVLYDDYAELERENEALRKDAERYRWLLEDHDDSETRSRRASICENMAVKSYSAVSRDIDAAIDSARNK